MQKDEEAINEKFQHVGLLSKLDGRNRITLSQALAVMGLLGDGKRIDEFEILVGGAGDILLRPRTTIPTRELWLHQDAKSMDTLKRGLNDAAQGKVKRVKHLKKFLDNL